MHYSLYGTSVQYFHSPGITSLSSLLDEVADWLVDTNACVEAMDTKYVYSDEGDYWAIHVNHSGTLVEKYNRISSVDISAEFYQLKLWIASATASIKKIDEAIN